MCHIIWKTFQENLSGILTGFGPCHGVLYVLYVLVPQPCRSAFPTRLASFKLKRSHRVHSDSESHPTHLVSFP